MILSCIGGRRWKQPLLVLASAAALAGCGNTDTADRFCASGPNGKAMIVFDDGEAEFRSVKENGTKQTMTASYHKENDDIFISDDESKAFTIRDDGTFRLRGVTFKPCDGDETI